MNPLTQAVAERITAETGEPFDAPRVTPVSGGCIHRGWCFSQGSRRYFVKTNDAASADMFAAEAEGLQAIAVTNTITVPHTIAHGATPDGAYLILNWCDMQGRGDPRRLGADLARLHAAPVGNRVGAPSGESFGAPSGESFGAPSGESFGAPSGESFGAPSGESFGAPSGESFGAPSGESFGAPSGGSFGSPSGESFGASRDNYIGTTPQANREHTDWWVFYREQRLAPMFDALERRGVTFRGATSLLDQLAHRFGDHQPRVSLVHGDLWTGNAGFLRDGTPIIFDCAAYRGDGEVDLAMSELFGGFGPAFFEGYREVLPIAPGYPRRRTLYNLYHILNHALLFGGGYACQAQNMITELNSGC
ncbi:fructosamine kinase family protein [Acanthopleuribacter pedis]|uniref:Fructosamine kinase family protein n=1 Tax=Acanthopleuribacter pedis TaxID=442870 RepID=A0A8J7Q5C3_9BACT|nr:fructosamine kinase family protein [Acanthopleuribacter pedis]